MTESSTRGRPASRRPSAATNRPPRFAGAGADVDHVVGAADGVLVAPPPPACCPCRPAWQAPSSIWFVAHAGRWSARRARTRPAGCCQLRRQGGCAAPRRRTAWAPRSSVVAQADFLRNSRGGCGSRCRSRAMSRHRPGGCSDSIQARQSLTRHCAMSVMPRPRSSRRAKAAFRRVPCRNWSGHRRVGHALDLGLLGKALLAALVVVVALGVVRPCAARASAPGRFPRSWCTSRAAVVAENRRGSSSG